MGFEFYAGAFLWASMILGASLLFAIPVTGLLIAGEWLVRRLRAAMARQREQRAG